jgi:multimeric flavodoxin WrbA
MAKPEVRTQSKFVPLTREQFRERFFAKFSDPAFDTVRAELEAVFERAWDGYHHYRKSPRTRPAGPGFAFPEQPLAIEWLEARAAIQVAEAQHRDPGGSQRVLVINGSTRSEHTCPGEISKTLRLAQKAEAVLRSRGCDVDLLDLSELAFEPWKVIHPCKACVSTSMPLCHWPCSCYPNHALGQTNDWMNEIYPRWVAAHGVFILCPVHWYQAPASLKLMMDRLVCADGGNPDPTTTQGKDPGAAKQIELNGWHYPRHLAGRAFAIAAHGDAAGPETLRRVLSEWLTDMGLIQAGPSAVIDAWVGYYQPYATSHQELDKDDDTFTRVENAALALVEMMSQVRTGTYRRPDEGLRPPKLK